MFSLIALVICYFIFDGTPEERANVPFVILGIFCILKFIAILLE